MDGKDKRANGSAADDAEFEKLLDEMDELGRQADALRKKVNHLIDEMRENDVPADEETDVPTDEEVNVPAAEEADEAADGGAVDQGSDVDNDRAAKDIAADGAATDEGSTVDSDTAGETIDENDKPDAT